MSEAAPYRRDSHPISLTECCSRFVTVDPITRVARLAHEDIAQYLWEHCDILLPFKKARLARTCVNYLLMKVFSTGSCLDREALSHQLQEYPFIKYAARYWGFHTRDAISGANTE